MAVLSMLFGAAAVLNGKFWAMVQAGKAHDALLFDPDGPFIPELDGRDRAVPGTQTAADAAVLHMEMVCLAHGRIFDLRMLLSKIG